MPLQTFLNLPEERRKMILDVAFEEFALHEYKVASIGNIIKKLEIAKGSFYRYFENKKALYFYLLDYAGKLRFEMVDHLFDDDEMDCHRTKSNRGNPGPCAGPDVNPTVVRRPGGLHWCS